jgi:hypothetical protein
MLLRIVVVQDPGAPDVMVVREPVTTLAVRDGAMAPQIMEQARGLLTLGERDMLRDLMGVPSIHEEPPEGWEHPEVEVSVELIAGMMEAAGHGARQAVVVGELAGSGQVTFPASSDVHSPVEGCRGGLGEGD